MTVAVAIRPVLGSLTFREVLTFGGQIRKYLLDLGDPCLEKLKRGVNLNQSWIEVYSVLAQNVI